MTESPSARRGRRLARAAGLVLASALSLEVLYLVAANAYLGSDHFARLMAAPHRKTRVTARRLFTPFPGRLRAEGLELRGQTPRLDWWLLADRASGRISLPALLSRSLEITGVRAEGVDFRLRRRVDTTPSAELAAALPELPEIEVVPRPGEPRRRFQVDVSVVRITDIREIWLDAFRTTGQLTARGGFRVRLGESAEVLPSSLEVQAGEVRVGQRLAAAGLTGRLEARIEPYRYREERGWALAPHLTGQAELEGGLADLSILDPWLGGIEWLLLRGGEGPFRLAAGLDHGEVRAGSSLQLLPRPLDVSILGYQAQGVGSLDWQVPPEREGMVLAARLPSFDLRREGDAEPYLAGRDLAVEVATADRRLDGTLRVGGARIDFPAGEVADLSAYNALLPERLGIEILGGRAEVSARFESPDGLRGSGSVRLSAPGARIRLAPLRFTGDLAVETLIESTDLPGRRFALDGTVLRLSGVTVEGASRPTRGWWGSFTVEKGTATPRASPSFEAGVKVRLRDSGPLIDVLTARRSWPDFVAEALTVEGIEGTARLAVSRRRLDLDNLHVRGGKLGLDARLRLVPGGKHGQLLAQYGRWVLGLELDAGERDWILVEPREWYRKETGVVVEAVEKGDGR